MKPEGFLTDFKRIQQISGVAATSGALMTLAILFFVPASREARNLIIGVSVSVLIFNAIYYLIPKLYLNKKLAFLPDATYIMAITFVMQALGKYGYVYFIFYMILVAIDAFIFPLYQYFFLVLFMILGIIYANFNSATGLSGSVLYQIYGLLTLAIVTHLIARDALKIKEREGILETDIQALENDKREIRQLLESISDGMFVVDAKNKINFYNKSALKILNIIGDDSSVLGRDVNDFLPTIGSSGKEPVTRAVFGGMMPIIRDDLRIVQANGVLRLHLNITPVITEDNKLQGAIIFFRDISKEKELDEERTEFNAVASHELRSPLSVIEGYLYFLLDPASGAKYDATTKDYIEKAHAASKNLINLISDILTVIKADQKKLTVAIEKTDVQKLVEEVVNELQPEAKAKKLKLEFKLLTKRTIPKVDSDPGKIKQVLANLIENALKFTEKGGITVEIGLLENEILVNVIDTGVGIDNQDQKLIFQKFYRSEDWRTRKTGGTGLGLYISKTLIETIGGKIGVQSQKKQGSRFYFTVPLSYNPKTDPKNAKITRLSSVS